jgi:hypothetical protein
VRFGIGELCELFRDFGLDLDACVASGMYALNNRFSRVFISLKKKIGCLLETMVLYSSVVSEKLCVCNQS